MPSASSVRRQPTENHRLIRHAALTHRPLTLSFQTTLEATSGACPTWDLGLRKGTNRVALHVGLRKANF